MSLLRLLPSAWLLSVLKDLLLDQVVSLREQIKRRQQGLDNGKEVTSAPPSRGGPAGPRLGWPSCQSGSGEVNQDSFTLPLLSTSGSPTDLRPSWTPRTWTGSGRARSSASARSWAS